MERPFLSTPSARRATEKVLRQLALVLISIHALREEGDANQRRVILTYEISIHALREEGDTSSVSLAAAAFYFYPRPPRGGRPRSSSSLNLSRIFLSTPSARRATIFSTRLS